MPMVVVKSQNHCQSDSLLESQADDEDVPLHRWGRAKVPIQSVH